MMPEQAALLAKARESLAAAQLLAENAHPDFAAARAYYAMFYVAQAFLLGEGLTFSKHAGVIANFGKEFAKTGRVPQAYHRYLIEAQQMRHTGDYDITAGALTADDAHRQIDRAAEFLHYAEDWLNQESPD